jgi:hypothetical protein
VVHAALAITARFALPKIEQGLRESGTSSAALTLLLAMSQIGTVPATIAAFAGLAGVFLAIRWSLPRMAGRLRVWLEYIPPWSIYRDMHGYLWICSFLAQCKIGIADVDALENQAQDSRSPWLRSRLNTVQALMVNEGVTLPRAMELSGLNFPSPEIIREIDDIWGDEGDYDTLLAQSKLWVDRIEDRTRTQIKVMRGVTTGAAILFIGLTRCHPATMCRSAPCFGIWQNPSRGQPRHRAGSSIRISTARCSKPWSALKCGPVRQRQTPAKVLLQHSIRPSSG